MAEEQVGPEASEVPGPAESPGIQDEGADGPATDAESEDRSPEARAADEYRARLLRLKADFDNYRRRMAQEQARWSDAAVGRFIEALLPVVDNLERATEAGGDGEAIRRGVELTVRQLQELLAKFGVEPMNPVGQAFDPTVHEAMLQVETTDHPDGQVIEELRKGYLFKRQVLRPSMVKVARRVTDEDGEDAAESQ